MDVLQQFNKQQVKDMSRPELRAGDIVRVETKITEGEKTRLQIFEGTVLAVRGSGPSRTVTVRRITGSFAVERIFPLYNPLITSIEIVKRQKVRRSKLNYLRHAGRRRVKEDIDAMQRHLKEEIDKKRLAAEAKKRADLEKEKAEKDALRQAQGELQKEEKAEAKAE